MTAITLAETLAALVESLEAPAGSGLVVEHASLEVPLEAQMATTRDVQPVFCASVPQSRWVTGFMPPVHLVHLDVAGVPAGEGEG